MAGDALMTVEEVARQLGVHPDTVRKWIRSKEIEAINLGGQAGYRISTSSLSKFLSERNNMHQNS